MTSVKRLNPTRHHDWAKLVEELEGAGLSLYKIGVCLGLRVTQVERIKAGSEPKYSTGELLIGLHDVMVTNVTTSSPNTD